MPRIRTIKPEFWTDEKVGECSIPARLLFIATWNIADDRGNLERSTKQLKVQVFPYDTVDVEKLLRELLKLRFLTEYEVEGKMFLHINGFHKHQKIDRPSAPRCPNYDCSSSTQRVVSEDSVSTQPQIDEDSWTEGKGREKEEEDKTPSVSPPSGEKKTKPVSERKAPGTRLPEKWTHQIAHETLAEKLGLDFYDELDKFKDYFWAEGKVKANWNRTFNNWLRRAAELKQQQKSWRR